MLLFFLWKLHNYNMHLAWCISWKHIKILLFFLWKLYNSKYAFCMIYFLETFQNTLIFQLKKYTTLNMHFLHNIFSGDIWKCSYFPSKRYARLLFIGAVQSWVKRLLTLRYNIFHGTKQLINAGLWSLHMISQYCSSNPGPILVFP